MSKGKKNEAKIGAALANALMSNPLTIKIPWYRRMFHGKKSLFTEKAVSRSHYKPHQGEREKARRLRQIASGFLQQEKETKL